MKRITTEEIKKFKEIIGKMRVSNEDELVFFFPLKMEEKSTANDDGVQMMLTMVDERSGANALVNYGIVPIANGNTCDALVFGAIFDIRQAINLNLKDYLEIVNNSEELKELADVECKLIKRSALGFRIRN